MKNFMAIGYILALLVFSGCAEIMQEIENLNLRLPAPVADSEIAGGLKEALTVGAKNSSMRLSEVNGYYTDPVIKILLPDQASIIMDNARLIPGGAQLIEDVLLRINRSAEDAASQAAPIFVGSIKKLTIHDALAILQGPDDAATQYLRKTTLAELSSLYRPKIDISLNKNLVGTVSTNAVWETLTGKWNGIAQSAAGRIAGLEPVSIDLGAYLTDKALDGLFYKIAAEETAIRNNPGARITPLLQRVFGALD